MPTGRDAVTGFLPGLKATGINWTIHRMLQDGEFVMLHNSFTNTLAFGVPEIVTIDIYRMENGQAAEHLARDPARPDRRPCQHQRHVRRL